MKFVFTVNGSEEEIAHTVRYHLEGIVSTNRLLMRRLGSKRIPPLYESGVVYRPEPWALPADGSEGVQFLANCIEILANRHSECKGLCAYRVAELRERHPELLFGFNIYSRNDVDAARLGVGTVGEKIDLFHVQVRVPWESQIEDPSRLLAR